jgi:superfamily II DNA or RNA helicase
MTNGAFKVGDVFRGKHRDNKSKFIKILAVEAVQIQTLSLDGRRSWVGYSHLTTRYERVSLAEAPTFPEPKSQTPLPPRRHAASEPLLTLVRPETMASNAGPSEDRREDTERVYGTLRQHQWEACQLIRRFFRGTFDRRRAFVFATPGSGKSGLTKVAIHESIKRGIKRFLIVVPRKSLQQQMIDDLRKETFGGPLLAASNTGNRTVWDYRIVVCTIQKLIKEHKHYEKFVAAEDSVVFIDEAHHLAGREDGDEPEDVDEADVADGSEWKKKVAPTVNAATFAFCMSGTPFRGDGQPIPFLIYDESGQPKFDIAYGRAKAILDGAIRPTNWRLMDGKATFERWRKEFETNLSEAPKAIESNALRTVLGNPAFRNWMLLEALKDWLAYRRRTNHKSKAIILAPSQKVAHELAALIESTIGMQVAVAISEKKNAHEALNQFRTTEIFDVLVTVQMAYEGLDVPSATHLICLSRFRKQGWLEQAFARVTRIDRHCPVPPQEQSAFIYVPDSKTMRGIIEKLCSEEQAALQEPKSRPRQAETPTPSPRLSSDGRISGPSTRSPARFETVATTWCLAPQSRLASTGPARCWVTMRRGSLLSGC